MQLTIEIDDDLGNDWFEMSRILELDFNVLVQEIVNDFMKTKLELLRNEFI